MLEYLAPFRSRRMLMCSNDGRVEQEIRELGVPTNRLEHLSPDTAFAPATEPFVDRAPGTKSFRQIAPGSADACDPEHSIDE